MNFSMFWFVFCPLDPHILYYPGRQNVADPTDPDPKQWKCLTYLHYHLKKDVYKCKSKN